MIEKIKKWLTGNPDLAFAMLLACCVYGYFAITNEYFMTGRTTFAIMERFAVLGLVGLALTLCIIAGEIDLSIGSNAALAAVIVVRFTDSLGAPTALLIAVLVSTSIGIIQGYFIAYLRIRAIVLTVGTLMLLRGVALFVAEEKTVMLTDFRIPDFITTKYLYYFSPASILVITVFMIVGLFMSYTRYGREIYGVKYKGEIHAVMCFAFTNKIPKTVKDLDLLSKDAFLQSALRDQKVGKIAIAYTVWSKKKGGGKLIVKEVFKMIKKSNHLNRLVTLSPLTEMARKFHLRNGAIELQVNETTQNFEYKKL